MYLNNLTEIYKLFDLIILFFDLKWVLSNYLSNFMSIPVSCSCKGHFPGDSLLPIQKDMLIAEKYEVLKSQHSLKDDEGSFSEETEL